MIGTGLRQNGPEAEGSMRSMHIAKGELWLREVAGGAPRHVESPFARDVVERDALGRRTTSWKSAPREEQRLDTLIGDARYDHVAPRMDVAGNLYAICRPFDKPATQTLATTLTDTLFFPWRLLKAIFGCNFFTTS
jgi:hypothetical protein